MRNLLDGWFKIDIGEAAFYSLFGLLFVITGITLLVLIFMTLGFAMKKITTRKKGDKKSKQPAQAKVVEASETDIRDSGISPELVAVISAAIAAQLESEHSTCDFVVRRIKKI